MSIVLKEIVLMPESELRKMIEAKWTVKMFVSQVAGGAYIVDLQTDFFTARLCNRRGHRIRSWLDLDRTMRVVRSLGISIVEVRFS